MKNPEPEFWAPINQSRTNENKYTYLHDADDGSTIVRKVFQTTDHIGGVEKSLSMSRQKHEEAHQRHRRPRDQTDDGGPNEEIAQEALDRTGSVDHPWTTETRVTEGDGGIEKAWEDASVGANVLEDRNGVEGGLIIWLG